MKPENAIKLGAEGAVWCLSTTAIEYAMEQLQSQDRSVKHIWQYVSVSKAGLWSAVHTLQSYGIPVRMVEDFDIDEWSLTAIGLTEDGQVVKDEVWSSGA